MKSEARSLSGRGEGNTRLRVLHRRIAGVARESSYTPSNPQTEGNHGPIQGDMPGVLAAHSPHGPREGSDMNSSLLLLGMLTGAYLVLWWGGVL